MYKMENVIRDFLQEKPAPTLSSGMQTIQQLTILHRSVEIAMSLSEHFPVIPDEQASHFAPASEVFFVQPVRQRKDCCDNTSLFV